MWHLRIERPGAGKDDPAPGLSMRRCHMVRGLIQTLLTLSLPVSLAGCANGPCTTACAGTGHVFFTDPAGSGKNNAMQFEFTPPAGTVCIKGALAPPASYSTRWYNGSTQVWSLPKDTTVTDGCTLKPPVPVLIATYANGGVIPDTGWAAGNSDTGVEFTVAGGNAKRALALLPATVTYNNGASCVRKDGTGGVVPKPTPFTWTIDVNC